MPFGSQLKEVMTVVINGQEERRFVDYYEEVEHKGSWPFGRRAVPETRDGEKLMWILGDIRPHIAQGKTR